MSKYYHTCQDCGANLDPGEHCTCENLEPKLYRNGLVMVEALLWTGKNHAKIESFLTTDNFYYDFHQVTGGLIIKTAEGEHPANIGDYIVKDTKGNFYSCSPSVLEATCILQEE